MAKDPTFGPDNYETDGGNTSNFYGKVLHNGATAKVARGEVTLDGGNPTSVATGLTKIESASACIKTATAPGVDPTALTVNYGGAVAAGQLDIHAWKPTAVDNCTLIASTNNTAVISWIAIGE